MHKLRLRSKSAAAAGRSKEEAVSGGGDGRRSVSSSTSSKVKSPKKNNSKAAAALKASIQHVGADASAESVEQHHVNGPFSAQQRPPAAVPRNLLLGEDKDFRTSLILVRGVQLRCKNTSRYEECSSWTRYIFPLLLLSPTSRVGSPYFALQMARSSPSTRCRLI